jgi:indolepyruvate decarboxylase
MSSASSALTETTIPQHLVRRLSEHGVEMGFGIVGDYALRLFGALNDAGLPMLVTADEQGAGFAADAFARLRGFGMVGCTYGVGGLKLANAVANAWAEQVPLLVVSGSPGVAERASGAMLHHKIKDFDTQYRVFRDLTVAQALLDNPVTAAAQIDHVIARVLETQRPGYLEIPRDLIDGLIPAPAGPILVKPQRVDPFRLEAAVADVMSLLGSAKSAVILAGAQVSRRALGKSLLEIANHSGIPVATSSLGKGVFPEGHPLSLGVYQGVVSPAAVVDKVENAEAILSFGVLPTDLNFGGFTARIDPTLLVECTDDSVTVGLRTYRNVPLSAFLPALQEELAKKPAAVLPSLNPPPFVSQGEVPIHVERLIAALTHCLDARHGFIVDPGDCMFAAVELRVPNWCLSSAYYATMGYAVPAALGAGKADPGRRPVVLVGDGAFAMTGLEAGWCAFHGVHPIIIVMDNSGYGTQRPMRDGPFNDIAPMASERLTEVFGVGKGWLATTENQLVAALREAFASDTLAIIRVQVPKGSYSPALKRLTDALGKRV